MIHSGVLDGACVFWELLITRRTRWRASFQFRGRQECVTAAAPGVSLLAQATGRSTCVTARWSVNRIPLVYLVAGVWGERGNIHPAGTHGFISPQTRPSL